MKHLHRFVRRAAAFVLAAALVLTGCSAGSFLHFGKGSGGSTVQKIDRPAVESAELQFAHPAAGDTIAVFDTSAGVFKAVLFPDKAPQAYDNFTGLVQAGYYNGLTFSRVESGFVVEAGQGADGRGSTIWNGSRYPIEATDRLHHYAGALCAATDASGQCASVFYVMESLPGGNSSGTVGTELPEGASVDWRALEGQEFYGEYLAKTDPLGADVPNPVSHVAYGYATQMCILDKETGRIKKMVAAHDVGKAVNPLSIEGQIEGGVVMSMGYALTEKYPIDENCKPTAKYGMLGLFRANQIPPEIEAIVVEKPGLNVAGGAIGIGEITSIPTAPAIADAYYRLTGEREFDLPLKNTPYAPKK